MRASFLLLGAPGVCRVPPEARTAKAVAVASWDVFHADRLELERGQSAQAIHAALARGDLRDDDLVRPAGTTIPWSRIAEIPELLAPALEPVPEPPPNVSSAPSQADRSEDRLPDFEEIQPGLEDVIPPLKKHHPTELPDTSTSDVAIPILDEPEPRPLRFGAAHTPASSAAWVWADDDDEDEDEDEADRENTADQADIEVLADEVRDREGPGSPAAPHEGWEPSEDDLDLEASKSSRSSRVALPVVRSRDRDGTAMPGEDGEDPDAEFSLSRSATQKIEELDLAPMVDVAFQLVLFFMVTATTVLYKTLEIPKASAESPAGAVAQGRSRSLDDLKDDFILVEIDDRGAMKLDREPIEPVRETLVENLRRAERRPAARQCSCRRILAPFTATRCWPTMRPRR